MKTTIKKSELKKIYNIACAGWKSKIEKYAQSNPFEDEVTFTENQIKEMVSASNSEQLLVVKEVFDIQTITNKINSVEDACEYLGESDEEVKQLRLLNSVNGLSRNIIAEQELAVITRALNEKEELDWDKSNTYKYHIWWYLGSDFRLGIVDSFCLGSACSARLCYPSKEAALYSANTFKSIWKDYLNK